MNKLLSQLADLKKGRLITKFSENYRIFDVLIVGSSVETLFFSQNCKKPCAFSYKDHLLFPFECPHCKINVEKTSIFVDPQINKLIDDAAKHKKKGIRFYVQQQTEEIMLMWLPFRPQQQWKALSRQEELYCKPMSMIQYAKGLKKLSPNDKIKRKILSNEFIYGMKALKSDKQYIQSQKREPTLTHFDNLHSILYFKRDEYLYKYLCSGQFENVMLIGDEALAIKDNKVLSISEIQYEDKETLIFNEIAVLQKPLSPQYTVSFVKGNLYLFDSNQKITITNILSYSYSTLCVQPLVQGPQIGAKIICSQKGFYSLLLEEKSRGIHIKGCGIEYFLGFPKQIHISEIKRVFQFQKQVYLLGEKYVIELQKSQELYLLKRAYQYELNMNFKIQGAMIAHGLLQLVGTIENKLSWVCCELIPIQLKNDLQSESDQQAFI